VKRALIVIVAALLIAIVSGISDTSLALEPQAAQANSKHDRDIAKRARKIGVIHVVRIERTDGTESEGVLDEVLPDAIVVTHNDGRDVRRETIPFAEIEKIDEVHPQGQSHALRNTLIVVVAVVALGGTCAAAASPSQTSPMEKP
jgi:hypothetical protein